MLPYTLYIAHVHMRCIVYWIQLLQSLKASRVSLRVTCSQVQVYLSNVHQLSIYIRGSTVYCCIYCCISTAIAIYVQLLYVATQLKSTFSVQLQIHHCMDQKFLTAKKRTSCKGAWMHSSRKQLVQCNGMQGHMCNYNIAYI